MFFKALQVPHIIFSSPNLQIFLKILTIVTSELFSYLRPDPSISGFLHCLFTCWQCLHADMISLYVKKPVSIFCFLFPFPLKINAVSEPLLSCLTHVLPHLCFSNYFVALLNGSDLLETLAIPSFKSHVHFVLHMWFQRICPSPRPSITFDNMLVFKVRPIALPQSWKTTPCWLSIPTYSMHRVLILFNIYRLPLPAATPRCVGIQLCGLC
jgi:hypothetical protein